ncbi:MAG: DHA2 family efflux MFS transporter permease subunit [Rhodospirillales bacterium]|nr:DHA2 family efflux MFS transporter permease subunit [Rhodospirillales bacterium]MDE2200527.1 DHA2 family efflux MFS transporter permease subunit [Rhodospirillales bacterium]
MSVGAPKVPHRALITGCTMVATLMQALDSTIANVALPYMQGSLGATFDQITWVLTSYVIAAAIMTAPVGWLAARFGRKNLFLTCLAGFTVTSMMCGAAQSLAQIVAFRLLQGMFGAALVPLSQATMLDIYPFEKRAQAMAIWGIGVMIGPILGPTLGGYLTDFYNWRWVFYVNLPFGLLAMGGLWMFMPKGDADAGLKFDWTGFAVLALGIGSLQLMLDRGQTKDWFSTREIVVEAVLSGLGIYLFIVHMFTAERPFIPPPIFKDVNFSAALGMMFGIGMVLLASSALLAPYLQNLAGYPVATAGLAMAPRGVGTMAAMMLAGKLGGRVDPRKMMASGVILMCGTLYAMSGWTPDVPERQLVTTIVIQGFGMGLVFNPLSVMAFATLPARLRGDGAALLSLFRNIGSAIGVSITSFSLSRNAQVVQSSLSQVATPFNRVLHDGSPLARLLDPATPHGAQLLNGMIERQAQIIAYNDDYLLMTWLALPTLLLILLMRRASGPPPADSHVAMD